MAKTGYVRIEPIYATPLQAAKVVADIDKALADTGKKMATKFAGTVSAWQGIKPTMNSEVEDGAVWAGPDGTQEEVEKWTRLEDGTPRRDIEPAGGGWMIFPFQGRGKSYVASTTPRQFTSRTRQKLGPRVRRRVVHDHGPVEPREWSDEMIKQELEPFAARVQAAIDKGLD